MLATSDSRHASCSIASRERTANTLGPLRTRRTPGSVRAAANAVAISA